MSEPANKTGLPEIRQKSFEELEESLLSMERLYAGAMEAGDRQRARDCRKTVIVAKDRARFAARSAKTPEKRARKEEMRMWMLVWLENPGVFAEWVKLRKRAAHLTQPAAP